MLAPSDVAITPDLGTAYVVDRYARCIWKFRSGSTDVQENSDVPTGFSLSQNYPNPFNPSTIISFTLPKTTRVKLVITDLLGRDVATLVDGTLSAGRHAEAFNGEGLPSGIYFYTLLTPTSKSSMKMVFMK